MRLSQLEINLKRKLIVMDIRFEIWGISPGRLTVLAGKNSVTRCVRTNRVRAKIFDGLIYMIMLLFSKKNYDYDDDDDTNNMNNNNNNHRKKKKKRKIKKNRERKEVIHNLAVLLNLKERKIIAVDRENVRSSVVNEATETQEKRKPAELKETD